MGATHAGVGGGISEVDASKLYKYFGGKGGYGHYQEATTLGAGSVGAAGGAAVYIDAKIIIVN